MDPNIALLLLLTGLLGVYAEFCFPGKVLPGVLGSSICIYSIAALAAHPLSSLGISLLLGSFAFFAMDAVVQARGFLTVAGMVCMVVGTSRLIDSADPRLQIHPFTALAFAPVGLLTGFLFSVAYRARRNKLK